MIRSATLTQAADRIRILEKPRVASFTSRNGGIYEPYSGKSAEILYNRMWAQSVVSTISITCDSLISAVSGLPAPVLDPALFLNLHDYQVTGVQWMLRRLIPRTANVILADEPGVGKTLQALAVLRHFSADQGRPNLVLAPLSVVPQWASEAARFFPSLKVFVYSGTKEERLRTRSSLEASGGSGCPFHVLVTSYELAMVDGPEFLGRVNWNLLVVDEAHRLKNANTVLYKTLSEEYSFRRKVFLTGTPVMNNLDEFGNLLSFLLPLEDLSAFLQDKGNRDRLTEAVVLRRLASEVNLKLPERQEYLIKIPLTGFQKTMYQWVLSRESGNVLAGLRKVCNHPYLFNGVEPEPYMNGEHIAMNSAKLLVLDGLLGKIKNEKILIFSTSTRFLDVIQDLLDLRAVRYERLDGSVRGEDRYNSISRFTQSDEVSVFLLSVRAGGLGLCLTAASVVIVMDEDFNPHFTRQGIARAYRQRQEKPVTIYRLICQNTLDEIVYRRGLTKLKLSAEVLNEQDVLSKEEQAQLVAFGLSKLNLESDLVLSKTPPKAVRAPQVDLSAYDVEQLLASAERVVDRREEEDVPDENDMEVLRNFRPVGVEAGSRRDRTQRFNDEDRELILRIMEQNRKKRLQEREEFPSLAVPSDNEAEADADASSGEVTGQMRHVRGDVLSPEVSGTESVLVLLPVTAEGKFASTAFGAMQKQRLPQAAEYLKKARKAKALKMGDLHLMEFPEGTFAVGLAVCLSVSDDALDIAALGRAFRRVRSRFTIHLPRLGDRSGQFYAVERTLQHCAVARGLDVVIYYFALSEQTPEATEPPAKRPRLQAPTVYRSVRDFFRSPSGHGRDEKDSTGNRSSRLRFADEVPAALRQALLRAKVEFKDDVEVVSMSETGSFSKDASVDDFVRGGFRVSSEVLEFMLSRWFSLWE